MAILTDVSHANTADGNATHMTRNGVESLQTHALPVVQPTQSFTMGDHTGQHYHTVDALSSNVLPARERVAAASEARNKPPSTKRRKINTCFPCKQRKVKCDRQHPYCGQCQKHRIPAERCVWSTDMGVQPDMQAASALSFSKPESAHQSIGLSAAGEWPSTQTTELGLDNDARAVIERISHLEQRLASTAPAQAASHDISNTGAPNQAQIDPLLLAGTTLSLGDVNPERQGATASLSQDAAAAAELAFWRAKMEQHQRPPTHGGENAQMAQMQAEQNIAADALAMFARHNQQNTLSGGEQPQLARPQGGAVAGAETVPRQGLLGSVLDYSSLNVNSSAAAVRVRAALDALPSSQQVDYLFRILHTVDLHLEYGISWALVRTQLATLRTQLAGWNRMHTHVPDGLDVSFLALLLVLLALAARYTEPRFFIEQGLCGSPEQIPTLVDSWVDAAQALMALDDYVSKTNLNHISALYFCVDHQAFRGRMAAGLAQLALLVRLAEIQGYHRLGSARDDEMRWSNTTASKQVRVSAVAGVPSAGRASSAASSLPDRSHLVREAARRMWYKIASRDMVTGTHFSRSQAIEPDRVTTQVPLNVDETELPDGETHVLPPVKEDGRATLNNLTPYLYQIAEIVRQWSNLEDSRGVKYEDVLAFDAKYRDVFAALPVFLRPDPTLEQLPEVRQEQAERPYLAMHRLILFESVNHRLLTLHRPYLRCGHHDEKYAYSMRVAVEAARTIISCRRQIDNVHPAVQRHWVFRHHLFQAAIVLALHLLEITDKDQASSQMAQQLREDITLIMEYLTDANALADRSIASNSQKVALKLIDGLLAKDVERREGGAGDAKADTAQKSHATVSGISMDGSNPENLFQLPGASTSTSDPVGDSASAYMTQLLDPQLANSPAPTQLYTSLDELMAPSY